MSNLLHQLAHLFGLDSERPRKETIDGKEWWVWYCVDCGKVVAKWDPEARWFKHGNI